jgi:hypothetical protein
LSTTGAQFFEDFAINGTHYLVVANAYNGTSNLLNSTIYSWSSTFLKFIFFQDIPTKSAAALKYFNMSGNHFLAVANFRVDNTTYVTTNEIFLFTGQRFVSNQTITSNGSYYVTAFTMDGSQYIAFPNSGNPTSVLVESQVFVYSKTLFRFVLFQNISTSSANSIEAITVNGTTYLGLAQGKAISQLWTSNGTAPFRTFVCFDLIGV